MVSRVGASQMVEQGCLNEEEALSRETPQLLSLLKEMKDGLDTVRSKVQALTQKVKQSQLPTAEGMSYLEAKHILLLNYCQSIVYYILRKTKGLSTEGHPVVRSLVEIRLFLEKIRPIDKKLDYQVQKLTRASASSAHGEQKLHVHEEQEAASREEDPLRHRPNPDMLVSKTSQAQQDGGSVYRPPKFAPTSMDDDKMSKQEKQALRRDKELLRRTKQSSYMKELMDEFEDKPEEIVTEIVGSESREISRYVAKREDQARQEEELFTRAPITKREKRTERHMKKSRNGMLSLTDDFYNETMILPLEEKEHDNTPYKNSGGGGKRFKKRKRH